jgi:hypothetical protein
VLDNAAASEQYSNVLPQQQQQQQMQQSGGYPGMSSAGMQAGANGYGSGPMQQQQVSIAAAQPNSRRVPTSVSYPVCLGGMTVSVVDVMLFSTG